MRKSTATRHNRLQNRNAGLGADTSRDSRQSFEALVDLFLCGGGQRPASGSAMIPVALQEQGTKRSRQAAEVATRLSMKGHGWKQTGQSSPFWVFEHRGRHLRDRAAGRNHRLPRT